MESLVKHKNKTKDHYCQRLIGQCPRKGVCALKSTHPTPQRKQNEKSNFPIGVSFVLTSAPTMDLKDKPSTTENTPLPCTW